MQLRQLLLACAVSFASVCEARQEWGEIPANHYLWGSGGRPSTTLEKRVAAPTAAAGGDAACTNGPLTRNCWNKGYSIETDFDEKWPTTGKTVSYHLTVTNGTCNPDGASPGRTCYLVNGQFPGPQITANWGDYISVTVTNNMQDNGTGIHWHGVRQLNTNFMDGVSGITECALAPGQTKTYLFQATQFGTTWYHSHYTSQYGDGILGPLVINGPASANYDYDLGPVMVSDWFYESVYLANLQWGAALQRETFGPPGDTILINGKNVGSNGTTGSYTTMTLTPGKTYRIRLINTSVDNGIRVTLDGHPFQVITTDFVPIHPYTTNWVNLGIGQRYDVIITANQPVGNYWMHAQVNAACASANFGAGLAIFRYAGAPDTNPTTTPVAPPPNCADAFGVVTVPYVTNQVGSVSQFESQVRNLNVNLALPGTQTNYENIVTWGLNMTALDVSWETPTLTYVMNGTTVFPTYNNVISIPNEGMWTFWIIQEVGPGPPIPHPMHLHGHDFYILGSGTGIFNISSSPATLQYSNPPRRDTTLLPGGGWVVIAFATDNPGAWLFHCHIAWHISEGLGLQFLEATNKMVMPNKATYANQCAKWDSYYSTAYYKQIDSGL